MNEIIVFNLPIDLDERLKQMADQRKVSQSALIRMILENHVAANQMSSFQKPVAPRRKGGAA